MSNGGLTYFDLVRRQRLTMNPKSSKWRTLEYLTSKDEMREFMITTRVYGQPVQLMDSETFEITELDESLLDDDVGAGTTVYGLIIDEEFYLLPQK